MLLKKFPSFPFSILSTKTKCKFIQNHFFQFYSIYLRAKPLAEVFIGTQDSVVSSISLGGLEEGVDHTFPSGDVLLVIRYIISKTFPSVLVGLVLIIAVFGCNYLEAS